MGMDKQLQNSIKNLFLLLIALSRLPFAEKFNCEDFMPVGKKISFNP
jgi:hypothetical protein